MHSNLVLLSVCALLVPAAQDEPSRQPHLFKIKAGKKTTRLAPAGTFGFPNYAMHVERLDSKGVTRENNAALRIAPLMEGFDWTKHGDAFKGLPTDGLRFVPLPPASNDQKLAEILDHHWSNPWTGDADTDPVAAWLAKNREVITRVDDALTQCDRFFLPQIREPWRGVPATAMAVETDPAAAWLYTWRNVFELRCTNNLGKGDTRSAIRDVEKMFKLAQLCGQSSHLYRRIPANRLRENAFHAALMVCQDSGSKAPDMARLQRVVQAANPPSIIPTLEWCRYQYLDSVCHAANFGPDVFAAAADMWNFELAHRVRFGLVFAVADWNIVLKHGNEHFDELIEIAGYDDAKARAKQLDRLRRREMETGMRAYSAYHGIRYLAVDWPEALRLTGLHLARRLILREPTTVLDVLALTVALHGRATEWTKDLFLDYARSGSVYTVRSMDSAKAKHALALAAIAACRYRREHGAFPTKLKELVPEYLPTVPMDPHRSDGGPLSIKITDQQLLLYSVSRNRKDDTRVVVDVDVEYDDIIIRLAR